MTANHPVIELQALGKSYSLEARPAFRLWRQLTGHVDRGPQHHALQGVDMCIRGGETVGVIGRNGAGKSTLLQLICGVLQPTTGTRRVDGRVAALLELGAGFNPELTGRENVRLNGPLMGLGAAQIEKRLPEIVNVGTGLSSLGLLDDPIGDPCISLRFPKLPLLNGRYIVTFDASRDRSINPNAPAERVGTVDAMQGDARHSLLTSPQPSPLKVRS